MFRLQPVIIFREPQHLKTYEHFKMLCFSYLAINLLSVPTASCQTPTANCQPPTANCQLPTANCQPATPNCQQHRRRTIWSLQMAVLRLPQLNRTIAQALFENLALLDHYAVRYSSRNDPEERGSQLLRGRSLKSRSSLYSLILRICRSKQRK